MDGINARSTGKGYCIGFYRPVCPSFGRPSNGLRSELIGNGHGRWAARVYEWAVLYREGYMEKRDDIGQVGLWIAIIGYGYSSIMF